VSQSLRILDCACGIGTQALGLAKRGHMITGCDLSPAAIGRAREEASNRGLSIPLFVADMLDLTRIPENEFDAVVCLDNSLPHLESDEALLQATRQIRMKLRVDGTFIASVRDYDRDLAQEKPVIQGPSFYFDAGRRRIVHQVWDWIDDRRYTFHLYITREIPGRVGVRPLRFDLSGSVARRIDEHP
jgi:glycine/sarcosine N-methyltransferase